MLGIAPTRTTGGTRDDLRTQPRGGDYPRRLSMAGVGWSNLIPSEGGFQGSGAFRIEAYSEYMPPPRVGWKPYGPVPVNSHVFSTDDPFGWKVHEFDETLGVATRPLPDRQATDDAAQAAARRQSGNRPAEARIGKQSLLAARIGRRGKSQERPVCPLVAAVTSRALRMTRAAFVGRSLATVSRGQVRHFGRASSRPQESRRRRNGALAFSAACCMRSTAKTSRTLRDCTASAFAFSRKSGRISRFGAKVNCRRGPGRFCFVTTSPAKS